MQPSGTFSFILPILFIGMHDESITEGISEFDREMRRRVWCILVVWDRSVVHPLLDTSPMLMRISDSNP